METALADYLREAPVVVRLLSGEITDWTPGAERLYGYTRAEAVGKNCHQLFATVFPIPLDEINDMLLRDGYWQGQLAHTRKDGETIWTQSQWRLRHCGDAGEQIRVVEINTDVTLRETLARELHHRVKNTIAVVCGIARISLTSIKDSDEFKSFDARLRALAQAQDMLLENKWAHGELGEIIERCAASFGVKDRLRLSGGEIRLMPSSVLAYTLAIHELMTNSIKHGALSCAEGRVCLNWGAHGTTHKIHLIWREEHGPKVSPPTRMGSGMKLIEKLLKSELGDAPLEMRFDPDGFTCEIDGPTQKSPHLPGVNARQIQRATGAD
jgi:PAS domain S-box-containing protein